MEEGFAGEEKWVLRHLFRDQLDFAKLPPALFEALRTIQEAREKRKLVIFAGAGISFDSGAPLWKETSTAIMQAIGLESTCADATLIGQWLHNEKDEKEYNENSGRYLGTTGTCNQIQFITKYFGLDLAM
ncbi:MAG: hypothetical protein IPM82_14315 [Saprospiraceae bacterium]|nr:hypothetical protein [Saprospiraceae bacterium]